MLKARKLMETIELYMSFNCIDEVEELKQDLLKTSNHFSTGSDNHVSKNIFYDLSVKLCASILLPIVYEIFTIIGFL